jgi:hypothetical protein
VSPRIGGGELRFDEQLKVRLVDDDRALKSAVVFCAPGEDRSDARLLAYGLV